MILFRYPQAYGSLEPRYVASCTDTGIFPLPLEEKPSRKGCLQSMASVRPQENLRPKTGMMSFEAAPLGVAVMAKSFSIGLKSNLQESRKMLAADGSLRSSAMMRYYGRL